MLIHNNSSLHRSHSSSLISDMTWQWLEWIQDPMAHILNASEHLQYMCDSVACARTRFDPIEAINWSLHSSFFQNVFSLSYSLRACEYRTLVLWNFRAAVFLLPTRRSNPISFKWINMYLLSPTWPNTSCLKSRCQCIHMLCFYCIFDTFFSCEPQTCHREWACEFKHMLFYIRFFSHKTWSELCVLYNGRAVAGFRHSMVSLVMCNFFLVLMSYFNSHID